MRPSGSEPPRRSALRLAAIVTVHRGAADTSAIKLWVE
jgi:hypothetical protein